MAGLVALGVTEFVTKDGEQKTKFSRVGRAFKNQSGSLTILLDSVPLSGKLLVKKDEPREQQKGGADDDNIPFD